MPPRHKVRLTAWARICECLGLLDSGKTYGSEHTQLAGKCVGNTETEIYFIDKNTLLTITSCIYFSMAVAHIARVIFGAEIYFFGFSLPYLLCVLKTKISVSENPLFSEYKEKNNSGENCQNPCPQLLFAGKE